MVRLSLSLYHRRSSRPHRHCESRSVEPHHIFTVCLKLLSVRKKELHPPLERSMIRGFFLWNTFKFTESFLGYQISRVMGADFIIIFSVDDGFRHTVIGAYDYQATYRLCADGGDFVRFVRYQPGRVVPCHVGRRPSAAHLRHRKQAKRRYTGNGKRQVNDVEYTCKRTYPHKHTRTGKGVKVNLIIQIYSIYLPFGTQSLKDEMSEKVSKKTPLAIPKGGWDRGKRTFYG